jgi:hypothetical protein
MLARPPHVCATPDDALRLDVRDLSELQAAAARVELPPWLLELVRGLRGALAARGVYVSDRRWHKTISVLRTAALLAGRAAVSLHDLPLLAHCTWQTPSQRKEVEKALAERFVELFQAEPARYRALIETLEQTLTDEREAKRQAHDDRGLLFEVEDGAVLSEPASRRHKKNEHGELLFKRPPGGATTTRYAYTLEQLRTETPLEDMKELRRYASNPESWVIDEDARRPALVAAGYSGDHVGARLAQIDRIAGNLREFASAAAEMTADHAEDTSGTESETFCPLRPWPELVDAVGEARRDLARLEERLLVLRAGFAALPPRDAVRVAP